jgi:four helix bundle protein
MEELRCAEAAGALSVPDTRRWCMDTLELKERTKHFALRVMSLVDDLPNSAKARVLSNQILRSATSVAAGYRAACRARSRADWIDKIGRTLEEVDESALWLELITDGGLLTSERTSNLQQEADELTRIFSSISERRKAMES